MIDRLFEQEIAKFMKHLKLMKGKSTAVASLWSWRFER